MRTPHTHPAVVSLKPHLPTDRQSVPKNWSEESHRVHQHETTLGIMQGAAGEPSVFHKNPDRPLDHGIASVGARAEREESPGLAFVPVSEGVTPELTSAKERRLNRKMGLIRRSGLFGTDTKGARITRAATVEDLREAYKLVHRVYLGTGFISKEDAAMRIRMFETSKNTATFVAKVSDRVVGVLSIVQDTEEFGLPTDQVYGDELQILRSKGLRVVEVTNQAVEKEFRQSAVPTELMRCALAHSIEGGFGFGVAAVSPSHNTFYELLGFRQIGSERNYSDKLDDPVVLLQIDLAQHREVVWPEDPVERFMHAYLTAENPYFLYVAAWENVARERFRDPGLLRELFVETRDFLGECTEEQIRAVHQHWGGDLFAAVAGSRFAAMLPPIRPVLDEIGASREGVFSLHHAHSGDEDSLAHRMEMATAWGRSVEHSLPADKLQPTKSPHREVAPVVGEPAPRSTGFWVPRTNFNVRQMLSNIAEFLRQSGRHPTPGHS